MRQMGVGVAPLKQKTHRGRRMGEGLPNVEKTGEM